MIKRNYKLSILILLLLSWISFWFSINTKPNEIKNFLNSDIISIINTFRISVPILLSILSIPLAIFFFFKKKIYLNTSLTTKIIFFFLAYFALQGFGLYYNNLLDFNLNNLYLVILAIGSIEIIFFLKIFNLNKNFNFFLYISIFIISLISIILIINIIENDNITDIVYLYYSISLDQKIFGQVFPRITGLSRMLAVINLAILASFLFIKKNKSLKVMEFISIIIISTLIWSCQSRGSILCFSLTSLILIFFSKEYNIKKKIFVIFFIMIFPIIIFELYKNYKIDVLIKDLNLSTMDAKTYNEKLNALYYQNLNRIEKSTQFGSSGRINLWKDIIKKYDKKKIFGYGPQADRFLISSEIGQEYGNNVSNGFFYAFACSGYFGLIVFFFINLKMLIFLYESIFIQKIFMEKNYFAEKLATIYLIFFSIRILFENSYALFSVDFLMTLICFFIIADYLDKKNYLKSNCLK